MSPRCTSVSPGGECVVRNLEEKLVSLNPCAHSPHRKSSQASGSASGKSCTATEQIPVQMETDVSLQTIRKPFQNQIHVDSVGVGPCVLEVLFESLTQWIRNLKGSNGKRYKDVKGT